GREQHRPVVGRRERPGPRPAGRRHRELPGAGGAELRRGPGRAPRGGRWGLEHRTRILGEAPCWDGGTTYEASGDSIVIVDGVADGLTPVTLTHQGESNFAIWAWGESHPDLIVNDIGIYDG